MRKVFKAIAATAVVFSLLGSSNSIKAQAYNQHAYMCQHYTMRVCIGPVPGAEGYLSYYQDRCAYCGTVFGTTKGRAPELPSPFPW